MYLQFSTNTTRLCLCVPTLRALAPTRCRKRKEKKRSSGCNNIRWRSDRGAGLYRQLAPIVAACRLLLLLSKQASSSSSPPGRGLALGSSSRAVYAASLFPYLSVRGAKWRRPAAARWIASPCFHRFLHADTYPFCIFCG